MKSMITSGVVAMAVFFPAIANGQNKLPAEKAAMHFNWVMKEVRNPVSQNVLVVAHRGDWRNAPENSIQALKNCLAMGVDIMEIDLKMTRDSVLILMHDKTIDRTMTGSGKPDDFTLDSLKKMTLKSPHAGPTGHRVPTLEEFMMEAKGKMFINLDKSYPYLKQVYKVLEKTGTLNQVFVNGEKNYVENRKDYGALLSKFIFKPVLHLDRPLAAKEVGEYMNEFHPGVIELCFQRDTSHFIYNRKIFTKNKTKIWYNSLWADLCAGHEDDIAVEQNKPDESWGWLIQHGAGIIQTDRPKELLEYLRKKKLHP